MVISNLFKINSQMPQRWRCL